MAEVRASDTVKRGDAAGRIVRKTRCGATRCSSPRRRRRFGGKCFATRSPTWTQRTKQRWRSGRVIPVQLVDGDARNLKITTADDLEMAERLSSHLPRSASASATATTCTGWWPGGR